MHFSKAVPGFLVLVVICLFTACQKEYSIDLGVNTAAQGTLQDSTGNCLPNTVTGTFYNGITPGRDTAYVTVKVNVTTAGSYTIASNKINGVYFSDSGYFTSTGINTVRLRPVGTPLAIGATSYTFNFGSGACYFSIHVKDSTGTGLGGGGTGTPTGPTSGAGNWKFSAKAGDTTRGYNAAGTLVSAGGVNALSVTGTNLAGDTSINLALTLSSAAVPTSGQFTAASGKVTFLVSTLSGNIVYSGIAISGVTLTVNITSYDATSKELKGTFSGVVKDNGGRNVTLSAGSFDVLVQ